MNLEIGNMKDAKEWLTDEDWLVFGFDGDFCRFLEHEYFEPGTGKNAEFETLMLPQKGRISFWFRIKDTEENRENLRQALAEFYGPVRGDIDREIEAIQEKVRKKAATLEGENEAHL